MKKKIALLMAMVMLFGVTVAGTLAWLQDYTEPVKNTFTYGTIDIELKESDNLDLQMIPGSTITKDPYVKLLDGSEESWLFVEIIESDNFADFMTYTVNENWRKLTVEDGKNIYYYSTTVNAPSDKLPVLKDNQVTVKDEVTKGMMDNIKENLTSAPTLTFKAYAVQGENFTTAVDAWNATFGAPTTTDSE